MYFAHYEDFCFHQGFLGIPLFCDDELAPWKRFCRKNLLQDVRLQHAKTAYYLFEKIECKVEMAWGTQGHRNRIADFQ